MNWISGLQKAIDYIESHLTEELEAADIAAQANYSPYHFQRVFGILCGYSLGEYIRMRRLTPGRSLNVLVLFPRLFRRCSIRSILNSSPAANTSPAADLIFRFIRWEICIRISMCASYGFQLRRIHRTAVMLVNSGRQRKSGEKQDD